jgi:hypothetical protein
MLNDQLSWTGIIKVVVVVVLLSAGVVGFLRYIDDPSAANYVAVFVLGGLLGLTEIIGRYTDSPTAALKSPGAFCYVLLNALASCLALFLLLKLAPHAIENPISQVLVAGLGAMAFLRSSIFKVRVQDEEVAVGPAILLDTLLKFADAQVDRGRAVDRASRIASVIKSLPLAQAGADLPRLCFALMQNLPVDVRQRLLDDITLVVTDTKRSESVKVLEIGLVLWGRVGIGTLTGAVELIRQMSAAPAQLPGPAAPVPHPADAIVPPPTQGSPQDLIEEIQQQLAQDRRVAGS